MHKAMVIDDSSAMRMILSQTLLRLGFESRTAADGRQAFDLLEAEKPELDLILVDWNMPEMNGLEFTKSVRTLERYASTPLMMVTTETEMANVMQALDAGANEYVMKPFDEQILADKLRILGVLQEEEPAT